MFYVSLFFLFLLLLPFPSFAPTPLFPPALRSLLLLNRRDFYDSEEVLSEYDRLIQIHKLEDKEDKRRAAALLTAARGFYHARERPFYNRVIGWPPDDFPLWLRVSNQSIMFNFVFENGEKVLVTLCFPQAPSRMRNACRAPPLILKIPFIISLQPLSPFLTLRPQPSHLILQISSHLP